MTLTYEGGEGFSKSPELELVQLLINSMLCGDSFYESEEDRIARIRKLYDECNKKDVLFFLKATIFARHQFYLRSIPHLCASIVAEGITKGVYDHVNFVTNGKSPVRNFFNKVVNRGDDITEIVSAYANNPNAYKSSNGKVQLPKAVQRGLSDAIGRLDEYSLAKYRQDNKRFSMKNVALMTHAKKTDRNTSGLDKLFAGTLVNTTTWDSQLSKKDLSPKEVWTNFLNKGDSVEYFALLRNLRNIVELGDTELNAKASKLLANEKLVANSKVLPFRYLTAYNALSSADVPRDRNILVALNKACDLSLGNIPKLDGKTLIVVDGSGSMSSYVNRSAKLPVSCFTVGCMFGAALYKANDADMMIFSSDAEYIRLNPLDSLFTLIGRMHNPGWDTNLSAVFERADRAYDRVIILSDMQCWGRANTAFKNYKKRFNCNPMIYSFDLEGYSSLAFPESNVVHVGGFSDKAFDIIKYSEIDKKALINKVNEIIL